MPYQRNIFEKGFTKIKQQLHKETGNYHTDTYTGNSLKPGEAWDFEHIISAKEFSSLPNVGLLSADLQSNILNNRKNIGFTMRTINKSKGKHSLVEWLRWKSNGRTVTNAKFYGIDMDKSKKLRESTLRFLTSEIESALKN
jgi:hypothetical protein